MVEIREEDEMVEIRKIITMREVVLSELGVAGGTTRCACGRHGRDQQPVRRSLRR